MRITNYTLICVAVLMMALGCSKKEESPATDKYNQAIEMQEHERYKDALRLFHKTVQIDPNYAEAYLQIASIYDDHLEDKNRAVEWYQKYLEVSQNENQNKLVKKWLEDAKISAEEINSGAKGEMARLSPQVRNLIKKHVSLGHSRIKQEYKEKEKKLTKEHKNETKDIKEQLAEIKSINVDLKDKMDNLTIDLNASQKNSARKKVRDKLAGFLSSDPKPKSPKNTISTKKYIELESKMEETKVQVRQERAKGSKLERQVASLNENIRKLKQLHKTSDKDTAYQKQIEELQDKNTKFEEKIKLLENAAAISEHNNDSEISKNKEIRDLQNRISEMSDEKTKILAKKQSAEKALAQLQTRLDETNAGKSDVNFGQKAAEENKKLRQEIIRITSGFNEISKKHNYAEQKVQELQNEIDKLGKSSQTVKQVVVNDNFADLSEEITSMQKSIRDLKDIISIKDAQLLELITQNLKFQKAVENEKTDQIVKELNALLVKKNLHINDLADKLSKATMDQGGSTAEAGHVQVLSKQISELRDQLSKFADVNSRNKLLESNVNELKMQLIAANKVIKKYQEK